MPEPYYYAAQWWTTTSVTTNGVTANVFPTMTAATMPTTGTMPTITAATNAGTFYVGTVTVYQSAPRLAQPVGRRVIPPGQQPGYRPPGREEAKRRARELLLDHLDDVQRAEFERHGWFRVHVHTGDGVKVYRVLHYGGVELVDGDRPLRRYCIHPDMSYPEGDVALCQKLMLEAEHDEFLRTANEEILAY